MKEGIKILVTSKKKLNIIKSCLPSSSQLAYPESNTVNHLKEESFSK